jgi:N-alpha-acetyl-L-2,4-diaminobutyrate deacetylase
MKGARFMARVVARPNQLDLDSPGRRDYWVALEHDSIWGDHLIPLTVWVGPEAKPGEGLVSFGSNHGNEYEGPVVLKRLIREIRLEDVRGRIIFIPVLNPSAFRAGTRESRPDDGVNLNRAFVDGAGTTPRALGDHAPDRGLRAGADLAPGPCRDRPAFGGERGAVLALRQLSPGG